MISIDDTNLAYALSKYAVKLKNWQSNYLYNSVFIKNYLNSSPLTMKPIFLFPKLCLSGLFI